MVADGPCAPSDEESAARAVAPFREMTPAERWEALELLLEEVAQILGERPPVREEGETPFWKLWGDPSLGRPA